MTIKNLKYIILSIVSILIYSCANVSAPTGGPRDKTPPAIVKQTPENGTTNFREKQIRIWFDEFVHVSGLNDQFISSPPLKKTPKYILKGKSVVFTIQDTLQENTTYNLNFGNSVSDITENNPYKNLHIAFSTGPYIDSLSISGKAIFAKDLKPAEDCLILLYEDSYFYDSIPYLELPSYIGKTDKTGNFRIDYIKTGKYFVFGIIDKNKNRLFDLPEENICFLDSFITPRIEYIVKTDTVKIVSDTLSNDSLNTDSVKIVSDTIQVYKPDSLLLYVFEQENHIQYLTKSVRENRFKLNFIFNDALNEDFRIFGINYDINNKYQTELSVTKDTLTVWLTDSNIYKIDTLRIGLQYLATDTMQQLSSFTDTIKMVYRKKKTAKKKKNKHKNPAIKKNTENLLEITFNLKSGGKLDLNARLNFEVQQPVVEIDTSLLHLFKKKDTLLIPVSYKIQQDSTLKRRYFVDFDLKEETQYQLKADSGAIKSIYGKTNEDIILNFGTKSLSSYGNLSISVDSVEFPVVIQMLNAQGKVYKERYLSQKGKVLFDYLQPGVYKLKMILDKNKDGKWTTGDYLKKRQAEKIEYYFQDVKIRENWDNEINWKSQE